MVPWSVLNLETGETIEDGNEDENEETLDELMTEDDLKLDHIPDVSECRALRRQFSKQNFWPNVFHVNDHGNVDLLSIDENGATIVKSWV